MEAPSEQLTDKILEKLVSQRLILKEDALKLRAKFASGTLSPEDWRLPIEKAIESRQSK
jgi:hypothetical protein